MLVAFCISVTRIRNSSSSVLVLHVTKNPGTISRKRKELSEIRWCHRVPLSRTRERLLSDSRRCLVEPIVIGCCVGHTNWAWGPKGRSLEVGARRAPRLLVHVYCIFQTWLFHKCMFQNCIFLNCIFSNCIFPNCGIEMLFIDAHQVVEIAPAGEDQRATDWMKYIFNIFHFNPAPDHHHIFYPALVISFSLHLSYLFPCTWQLSYLFPCTCPSSYLHPKH